jgi:VIT1/CCC1 family predicted Fe2+/Mn2+ transporter
VWVGVSRVTLWGALAMAATAGVGSLFGTVA